MRSDLGILGGMPYLYISNAPLLPQTGFRTARERRGKARPGIERHDAPAHGRSDFFALWPRNGFFLQRSGSADLAGVWRKVEAWKRSPELAQEYRVALTMVTAGTNRFVGELENAGILLRRRPA